LESISPDDACDYLSRLVQDLLDPSTFDLLPFEVVAAAPDLRLAFQAAEDEEPPDSDYNALLREKVEDDQETQYPKHRAMKLLAVVEPGVPVDAYAKLRRRFRLLDRELEREPAAAGGTGRG
jgi:hypothetical protein